MLLHLLPLREAQLTAHYEASLALISDGRRENGGVAAGEAAAAAMIDARTDDGRTGGNSLFAVGSLAGEWRPLAVGANNFQWLGDVRPFLTPNVERFRTRGPLELTSAEYAAEFDQVKSLGRATGSTRTQDQTDPALFWNENAVAMWTRIARRVSMSQDLSGAARPI